MPGSSLPLGGSWRDTEDHAAPAVDAMCGGSTLAICSVFQNSKLFIPLVVLICASFWPPPFCANHVPPSPWALLSLLAAGSTGLSLLHLF